MRTGAETIPGLSLRKHDIRDWGSAALDIAIAMLESKSMRATYPLGDVYPNGTRKKGDAANFGIFKHNWLMIRASSPAFSKLGPTDFLKGAALTAGLRLDIEVLRASQRNFGLDRFWFAGHRNRSSGITAPDTQDIVAYRNAVFWIRDQLQAQSSCMTNDTRFWVDVRAI